MGYVAWPRASPPSTISIRRSRLARLAAGERDYISPELIARYRTLPFLHRRPRFAHDRKPAMVLRWRGRYIARSIPNSIVPWSRACRWDLGYLGTYSDDRQPPLDDLMLDAARRWPEGRFAVVGPLYPTDIRWPANVDREIHLSPREHPAFYGSQRFTLNITREAMKLAGYSPSVRLFEAGACGVPIISDWWEGLDSLFEIGKEVLISSGADDTLRFLREYSGRATARVGRSGPPSYPGGAYARDIVWRSSRAI